MAAPSAVTSVVRGRMTVDAALVGLQLQKQVHRCGAAVGAQLPSTAGRQRAPIASTHVAALIRDRLDGRSREVRPSGAPVMPTTVPRAAGSRRRAAEAGEGRDEVDAVVVGDFEAASGADLGRGSVDDLQSVPQPLDRGAGGEDRRLRARRRSRRRCRRSSPRSHATVVSSPSAGGGTSRRGS